MRAALACVGLLGACGFSGAAPSVDAGGLDAELDADVPDVDASPDASLGAWGSPMLVAELSSGVGDDDPTLTSDLRTIYFASNRFGGQGSQDIWMSTRAAVGAAWGTPTVVTELNTNAVESNIDVSGDGRTITFSSDRGGSGMEVYVSTLDPSSGQWRSPERLLGLRESGDATREYGAQLLGVGATFGFEVLYCQERDFVDEKLYFAQRQSLGDAFSNTQLIASLDNPTRDECDPWLVGRTLYFTRNEGNSTPREIYSAERIPSTANDYDTVQLIDVGGPGQDNSDPWVSLDQRTLFFASRRADGITESIYMSVR